MQLARRHRLTVYDAAYLELALRQGHPLATLERPNYRFFPVALTVLRRAAFAAGPRS